MKNQDNNFIPRHELEAQEIWDMYSGMFLFKRKRKKKCLMPVETILENLRTLESLGLSSSGGEVVRKELHHWLLVKQEIEKK